MRYFVVSDIHSCYKELKEGLDNAGFNAFIDTLIVNGDLFDRGEEAKKVLDFIKSIPNKILIRGNHEYLLKKLVNKMYPQSHDFSNGTLFTAFQLYKARHPRTKIFDAYEDFKKDNEEYYTLNNWIEFQKFNDYFYSYFDTKVWDKVRKDLSESGLLDWIFSDEWVDYVEIGNYIITHSFIPRQGDWRTSATKEQWEEATWGCPYALYDNGYFDEEKKKGKILVCGHWHSRDFHIHYEDKLNTITMDYDIDDSMYAGDHLIAIDGCTILSHKVNVLVIED